MSANGESFSIDQARGALGWLLSHWWGEEGSTSEDMNREYEYAREILGGRLVDELGGRLGNPTPTSFYRERMYQSGPLFEAGTPIGDFDPWAAAEGSASGGAA